MDIILIVFFLTFGLYSSFLMGVLNSLSQDFINELCEKNELIKPKTEKVWDNFDKVFESLHLGEYLSFVVSFFVFGFIVSKYPIPFWQTFLLFFIPLIITIIARFVVLSLGRRNGESVFASQINPLLFYKWLLSPLYLISSAITSLVMGKAELEDDSREEIEAAVETAREEGSLDDDEYRILKNIMKFSEVLVSDVMTPRTVIFSCNADKKVDEVVNIQELRMYSRFPIWEGDSLDDGVMGYVMSKDILQAALQGKRETPLRDFCRDVYYIPENAQLDNALDMFLNRRQHLFVVVDEYGGVEGLLTMEDVLETMLGVEIVDEADHFVDMRILAKQRRDRRISSVST